MQYHHIPITSPHFFPCEKVQESHLDHGILGDFPTLSVKQLEKQDHCLLFRLLLPQIPQCKYTQEAQSF